MKLGDEGVGARFHQPLTERRGEAHFLPIDDFAREDVFHGALQNVLAHAAAKLHAVGNGGGEFDERVVQKRDAAFDGAGTGDDGEVAAPNGGVGAGEADDGVFFFDIAAGQLVGLGTSTRLRPSVVRI